MSADPNDTQAQLDALNLKRQRLASIAEQLGQGQPQQVVGGRVMDQGFAPAIQAIASVIAGTRGQAADAQAMNLQRQATQQKEAKQQQALQALLGGQAPQQPAPEAPADVPQMSQAPRKPSLVDALMGPQKMSTLGAPSAPSAASPDPQANYRATMAAAANPALAGVNPAVIQAALANAKPGADFSLPAGETRYDASGKPIVSAAPKEQQFEHTADGLLFKAGKFYDPDGKPMTAAQVRDWKISLSSDRSKAVAAGKGTFGNDQGDLLGALAERGISLPAGLRSKEQQIATLNGLYARNPGKSADEIADKIKTGQIDFGAEKKFTTTAAGVGGKVAIAGNEIDSFAPLVLDASAKVPRGQFVPLTKLMQMGDTSISDPNLKQLKIGINSMLNAYDLLAARGGTDKAKREEAHSLLLSAESPEALQAGIQMFQKEAGAAAQAAEKAMKGSKQSSPAHPPQIQSLLDKYK